MRNRQGAVASRHISVPSHSAALLRRPNRGHPDTVASGTRSQPDFGKPRKELQTPPVLPKALQRHCTIEDLRAAPFRRLVEEQGLSLLLSA